MSTEVTLKNGVWVHETEWAAIQRLIQAVEDSLRNGTTAGGEIEDAYWCWRHSDMDMEEQSRVIRKLTSMIDELTSIDDDVSLTSVS